MDHRLSHGKSEITDFELTNEWRKHLLFQGFNSTSKSLNKFVEFYDRLDMVKYIFEDKGDGTHLVQKNSSDKNQSAPLTLNKKMGSK